MNGFKSILAAATVGLIATAGMVSAKTVGVSGPLSSSGVAASIIAAPADVTNAQVTNLAQQGFDEQQNVLLGAALDVDGGSIAAGTRVNSHMIFLNKPRNMRGQLSHTNVIWEFSGMILGVMSDGRGNLEAASTGILGAIGTTYQAPIRARGFESNDSYLIGGLGDRFLTVNMQVTQPGDWIRVVTAAEVPVPAALPLMLAGLGGLGAISRRKKRKAA